MYQYNNLDDFVAYGKTLTISYQNLSLTEIFNDIKFPMFNIIQDYIEELKDEAITITFTDKEYYTNSYYLGNKENMDLLERLKFESEFQDLSNGGAVSCISVDSISNNLEEFENVI